MAIARKTNAEALRDQYVTGKIELAEFERLMNQLIQNGNEDKVVAYRLPKER